MENFTTKKCQKTKCGEFDFRPGRMLQFNILAANEAVIQPSTTVIMPIKYHKQQRQLCGNERHVLWNLVLDAKISDKLKIGMQRQPIRPCRFESISFYNNSNTPFIINPGQILAKIDNRDQLSWGDLETKFVKNRPTPQYDKNKFKNQNERARKRPEDRVLQFN